MVTFEHLIKIKLKLFLYLYIFLFKLQNFWSDISINTLVHVLEYKYLIKYLSFDNIESTSRFHPDHFLDQVLIQVLEPHS